MRRHRELPFIAQTLAVLSEHCGDEQADLILSEAEHRLAKLEADPLFARRPVAQCSGPGAPEDELWTLLWVELARRQPALFGPELADLSEQPRGPSLAWLYIRHRHPEQLHAGVADDAAGVELCARVVDEVCPAVAQLAGDGVLPAVQTVFWRVTANCVLNTYLRHHRWMAINLFCEPALRNHTFLASAAMVDLTSEAPTDSEAIHLLLHEHVHSSLTHGAAPARPVRLGQLMVALNEAVVDVLSCHAAGHTFEPPMPLALTRSMYPQSTLALLSLLPALTDDEVPRLAALGRSNLQADSDDAAAELLSSFAGIKRTADAWLATFTSLETSIELTLTSPTLSTYTHYENGAFARYYDYADDDDDFGERAVEEHYRDYPVRLHCDDGPGLIRANGDREYYDEGLLHRSDGPALLDSDGSYVYYRKGQLHREDGPAVVVVAGAGGEVRPHPDDDWFDVEGPAQIYFEHDLLHRHAEDGPALIAGENSERQEYWEHGRRVAPPKPPRKTRRRSVRTPVPTASAGWTTSPPRSPLRSPLIRLAATADTEPRVLMPKPQPRRADPPIEPPPASGPAPDEIDFLLRRLGEDRCDVCGEVFPLDGLPEVEYGAGEDEATLFICDACLDDYKRCYECERWFKLDDLVAIAPERLAKLYTADELAAAERELAGVDETICWRCEHICDRERPPASVTGTQAPADLSVMDDFLNGVATRLRAGERPETVEMHRHGEDISVTVEYGNDDYDGGGPYALVYWAPPSDWRVVIDDGSSEGTWGDMRGCRFDLPDSEDNALIEPPPYSEPAPDEYDFPFGPLLADEGRCDDCGQVFPEDELSSVEYGAGEDEKELLLCEGCNGNYLACYDCGRSFMTGDLNGIAPERLAEFYSAEELAAAERDGTGVDETICWRCESIWERAHAQRDADVELAPAPGDRREAGA